MSRTNELRRQATEAVRSRRYEKAAELYERICDKDPTNGAPRNELGDLHLKLGDTTTAIEWFVRAAALYHSYGLTNNAVAVLKKILRHDPNHLDALWTLGEIRLAQGIDGEASNWFMDFLSRADQVPQRARESYVEQALTLLEKVEDDLDILSRLEEICRAWELGDESARVLLAKARQAHAEGEFDVRDLYVAHAREACEHLEAMPDYKAYRMAVDPYAKSAEGQDPGESRSDADSPEAAVAEVEVDPASTVDPTEASRQLEASVEASKSDELEFTPIEVDSAVDAGALDLGFDIDSDALSGSVTAFAVDAGESGAPQEDAASTDDSLQLVEAFPGAGARDFAPEIEELAAANRADHAHGAVAAPVDAQDENESWAVFEGSPEVASRSDFDTANESKDEPSEGVDLLAEILSSTSFDVSEDQQRQVDTIAQEMEGQIANSVAADDFAGQYEIGIVYMDMGLYEQAIASFDVAMSGESGRIRAMEMKGTCLHRLDRPEEAMEVFQAGLGIGDEPREAYIGLLYGVGLCHEMSGHAADAREYYLRVSDIDERFLDVAERLSRLSVES